MSLVSHLKDTSSPVSRFFAERFTNVSAARASLSPTDDPGIVLGRYLASEDLPKRAAWRLGEPVVTPDLEDRRAYRWSTIGVAFDYRVRFFFAPSDGDHRVARIGAERLGNSWGAASNVSRAYEELEDRLLELRHQEPALRGDPEFEHQLGALCFALALYEEYFRMGGAGRSPLEDLGPLTDLDTVLTLASQSARADLAALARHLTMTQGAQLASPIVPNPTFAGSHLVGGADADVIAGHRLIDVKTVTASQIERVDLWQIIGYALLDLDRSYAVDEVGIYYSRHGVQVVWPLADLLSLMSGRPVSADDARRDFEVILRALL